MPADPIGPGRTGPRGDRRANDLKISRRIAGLTGRAFGRSMQFAESEDIVTRMVDPLRYLRDLVAAKLTFRG